MKCNVFLIFIFAGGLFFLCSCGNNDSQSATHDSITVSTVGDSSPTATTAPDTTFSNTASLPQPFATKSVQNYCKVIGWPAGKTPVAPAGFTVTKFADSLNNPRTIYVADNGDIFVAEANTEVTGVKKLAADATGKGKSQNLGKSANRILLFRGQPGGPIKKYIFLRGLHQPYGMLIIDNHFYVANTDGLLQFDYNPADTGISGAGKQIVSLPAGGYNNHWTRNIVTDQQKSKIYISVGSGSNVAEHGIENEIRRADILEVNTDGSGERIFAAGLRNPAGIAFQPEDHRLWVAVNERDELGDELVPDYITSVRQGDFFGWPYSYFGQHPDPRMKDNPRPDLVQKARVPDYPVGAHTASLGLTFYTGQAFPQKYHNGAFVGQHGSWNRSQLSGYKVAFIPFRDGKPAGRMQDFLTGFVADAEKKEVYGRPVGIAVLKNGAILVADDASNTLWMINSSKN